MSVRYPKLFLECLNNKRAAVLSLQLRTFRFAFIKKVMSKGLTMSRVDEDINPGGL